MLIQFGDKGHNSRKGNQMSQEKQQTDGAEAQSTVLNLTAGHLAQVDPKFITGAKLYAILGCITLAVFLVLMDVSVLSTVS